MYTYTYIYILTCTWLRDPSVSELRFTLRSISGRGTHTTHIYEYVYMYIFALTCTLFTGSGTPRYLSCGSPFSQSRAEAHTHTHTHTHIHRGLSRPIYIHMYFHIYMVYSLRACLLTGTPRYLSCGSPFSQSRAEAHTPHIYINMYICICLHSFAPCLLAQGPLGI